MNKVCDVCGTEFFFATQISGQGRCKCIRDFWAAEKEEQIKLFPSVKQLAENGNTSAMGNLVGAQKHLGLPEDDYQAWVFKAAESGDLNAIQSYVEEFLIEELEADEIHDNEQSELFERYCNALNEIGVGQGDYLRHEYLNQIGEWDKSDEYIIKSANRGNPSALLEIFVDNIDNFDNEQRESIVRENLRIGRWIAASFFADYLQEEDPETAKSWYQVALATSGSSAGSFVAKDLAALCFKLQDWKDCVKAYEIFLREPEEIKDDYTWTFAQAGWAASQLKDYSTAEKFWSLGAQRGNQNCKNNLGWLSMERGLVSAAIYWYEQTAMENNEFGIQGIIKAKKALGDFPEAAVWEQRLQALKVSSTSNQHSNSAKPSPKLIKSPRDAEESAAAWMEYFGFTEVQVTPVGKDGGIDVFAREAIAQVKMEGVSTSRPVVQALFGVAISEGKLGCFFSLSGYTKDATDWADQVGLALFEFDFQGIPVAISTKAHSLLNRKP